MCKPFHASPVCPIDSPLINGSADSRTVNSENELAADGDTDISYDNNGNMLNDNVGGRGHTFVYDAWNRLVLVNDPNGFVVAFTYDGLGRRAQEIWLNGSDLQPTDLYCSTQWQIIETKNDTDGHRNITGAIVDSYWSPVFVNALVLRDANGSSGDGLEERLYFTSDANYDVTAAINTSGTVQQRMSYTSYGVVTFMNASWVSQDDSLSLLTLYQGGHYNVWFNGYDFQNRTYLPELMRWTTSDPMGYVDGLNDQVFVEDNPINGLDPTGERKIVVMFEGKIFDPTKERYGQTLGNNIPSNHPEDVEYIYENQDDTGGIADALKHVGESASEHHPIYSEDPGSKGRLVTCFHDTVIVIGFSFGGDAAIQFANDLKKQYGVTVSAGLTIDPRRRPLGQFAEIPFGQPSAGSWTNYFEKGDLALRGTEVAGANNIELKKDDFREFVTPTLSLDTIYSHAHQDGYVTKLTRVVAALRAILESVPDMQGHQ